MSLTKDQNKKPIQRLIRFIDSNPDARELKRALAVKLALSGYTYQRISEILNISQSFVSKWKKLFIREGIDGLRLKYKGAQKKLAPAQEAETIKWLLCQDYWDLSELEIYLIESYDVVFKSKESYYKIYKKAKITRQKAEKINPRKNPETVKKRNEEINQILSERQEELEAGTLIAYAIDECHLMGGDIVGLAWGDSTKRVKIPVKNYRDRQTYYGGLDLLNQQLVLEKYPTGNGACTVNFLKKLISINPGKKLLIIWDGAKYHLGKEMKNFLAEINDGLDKNQWKITCELFAPYAPEENPVEFGFN